MDKKGDVIDTNEINEGPTMNRREITLEDGRYMIFYTFGDKPTCNQENEQGDDV